MSRLIRIQCSIVDFFCHPAISIRERALVGDALAETVGVRGLCGGSAGGRRKTGGEGEERTHSEDVKEPEDRVRHGYCKHPLRCRSDGREWRGWGLRTAARRRDKDGVGWRGIVGLAEGTFSDAKRA